VPCAVLHVTTAHSPRDVRIFHKEVLTLVRHGYALALATTVDARDVIDGVQLLPLGGYHTSRWRRIPRNVRALWHMLAGRFDVVHIHDPELLLTIVPIRLMSRRMRIIYDVHEFYYERIVESDWIWPGARVLAACLYRGLERLILPRLAGIVVVTEKMEADYRRRFPESQIALVRNFPDIDDDLRSLAWRHGPPLDRPYVVHHGGAKRLRAFEVMVGAAERLRERGVDAPIINIGTVDLSAFSVREKGILLERAREADVRLLGTLPYADVLRWVAHARVGYIVYRDLANYRLALPTKLFEYFALGIPVVSPSLGRMAEIVREYRAGLVVPPNDIEAHADALQRVLTDDALANSLSQASRRAARDFTFEPERARLLQLYERTMPMHTTNGTPRTATSA
jgi:glycosyltransferase involved in cell wall biosynthesis